MTADLELAAQAAAQSYWKAYAAFNEAGRTFDESNLKKASDDLESAVHDVFTTLFPTPALLSEKVRIAMIDIDNREAKEWLETIKADLDYISQSH